MLKEYPSVCYRKRRKLWSVQTVAVSANGRSQKGSPLFAVAKEGSLWSVQTVAVSANGRIQKGSPVQGELSSETRLRGCYRLKHCGNPYFK